MQATRVLYDNGKVHIEPQHRTHFSYILQTTNFQQRGSNSVKWKDFIAPICKSKISSSPPYIILMELFEEAASAHEFSEATAKSWINEKRNCKTSKYFPSGKIDTENLFRYFRKRPNDKLQKLQQLFQDNRDNIDSDSPIDADTDNLDIFCWSLVNQFLDFLGFQRVDIPHTDSSSKTTVAETDQLLNGQSTDISEDTTSGTGQTVPYSSPKMSCTGVLVQRKRSIRSMFLPHSDDCCYHCAYWQGNRKTLEAYLIETYGFCLKYNRDKQISSAMPCEDYEKRERGAGEW